LFRFGDFIPAKLLASFLPDKYELVKSDPHLYADDFTKQFYLDIGMKYVVFFIIQIFIP